MASGKTLTQKLSIKEGQRILLVNPPEGYEKLLTDLPRGTTVSTQQNGVFDVIQCFVTSQAQLEELLPKLKAAVTKKGILWIAYPKGTSKKFNSDANRDSIRLFAQTVGLETVALFAIDDDWSSLRLKFVG